MGSFLCVAQCAAGGAGHNILSAHGCNHGVPVATCRTGAGVLPHLLTGLKAANTQLWDAGKLPLKRSLTNIFRFSRVTCFETRILLGPA